MATRTTIPQKFPEGSKVSPYLKALIAEHGEAAAVKEHIRYLVGIYARRPDAKTKDPLRQLALKLAAAGKKPADIAKPIRASKWNKVAKPKASKPAAKKPAAKKVLKRGGSRNGPVTQVQPPTQEAS